MNVCVRGWQGAPAWSSSEPRFLALTEFLTQQGDAASEKTLSFRQVEPPAVLTGGDVPRGRAVFNEACAACHGVDGVGSPRGPISRARSRARRTSPVVCAAFRSWAECRSGLKIASVMSSCSISSRCARLSARDEKRTLVPGRCTLLLPHARRELARRDAAPCESRASAARFTLGDGPAGSLISAAASR
ncbi:MAG: c-type cytochrome [Archangium sp.]|nr:c-type cytochrome [Archangium sp.]